MNGKEVEQRFNQLLTNNLFTCTKDELDMFVNYGLLLKSGKKYVTRNNIKVNLDVLEQKVFNMSVNLSNLICECVSISHNSGTNKVYCMSKKLYDKYSDMGLIVIKDGLEYYRLFNNELWAINLI